MRMPLELGPLPDAPSTVTDPRSGRSKPAMMLIKVDFPQPEGPTIATNSPSATSKLTPSTTCRAPWSVTKRLATSLTEILMGIAPLDQSEALHESHDAIERETDQADDHHPADDQIVAVAGIARVDDEIAESGAKRDHLGRHDHEPGHTEADPHADD